MQAVGRSKWALLCSAPFFLSTWRGLASSGVSMPIPVRRPMPVFVRDDTVSIRQLVLARATPGFPPVFTVSFADVRGDLDCGTPPGRAGCNTSFP